MNLKDSTMPVIKQAKQFEEEKIERLLIADNLIQLPKIRIPHPPKVIKSVVKAVSDLKPERAIQVTKSV